MVQAIQKYHPQFTFQPAQRPGIRDRRTGDLKAKYKTQDGIGGLQLSLFEELAEHNCSNLPSSSIIRLKSPAGSQQRLEPGDHRTLRAFHRRTRDRQRLLRTERCGGSGIPLRRAVAAKGCRPDEEAMFKDSDYVRALEYGCRQLPGKAWHRQAGDAAHRLRSIRDVIRSLTLRPES